MSEGHGVPTLPVADEPPVQLEAQAEPPVVFTPELDYAAEERKEKRKTALAWGLGAGVALLATFGVLLCPATGRTAGATISGHVQKIEHRMDGLEAVDQAPQDQPAQDIGVEPK